MATDSPAPVQSEPIPNPTLSRAPSQYLEDMDELKKVFNQFDSNGDGKISVEEIDDVLRTLGSGVPPDDLRRVVDGLDIDHDGFISLSEFSAFYRSDMPDGGDAELQDAFDLYDRDKNGLISAEDLHLALNRLGMKCSVEECRDMIKSVDSDGDGCVNFGEFKKMMTATNRAVNGSGQ